MEDEKMCEFYPNEIYAVLVDALPECCGECRFEAADDKGRFCMITDKRLGDITEQGDRDGACPLEVVEDY